jgi:hypothetical protein
MLDPTARECPEIHVFRAMDEHPIIMERHTSGTEYKSTLPNLEVKHDNPRQRLLKFLFPWVGSAIFGVSV